MRDPEVLRVLRRWLRYAEEDLRSAEILLKQGGVPRISCFHAQQAAEKSSPQTPLDRRLAEIRERIKGGGQPLLSWDEIQHIAMTLTRMQPQTQLSLWLCLDTRLRSATGRRLPVCLMVRNSAS